MLQSDLEQHLSPNCGPRRDAIKPHLIVLHYTAMSDARAAIDRLCDPQYEVSAHYLIAHEGQITQIVPEDQRAWHAGAGEWLGLDDINSRSIGIELDNAGTHPFSAPLMDALEHLLSGIMARWNIAPEGVIGHSDMAPGRKVDPGPHFDWARLALKGLAATGGHDTGPDDPTPAQFRAIARQSGYTADVDDQTLLQAVRLRFRQQAKGPLAPQDFTPLGHTALWT